MLALVMLMVAGDSYAAFDLQRMQKLVDRYDHCLEVGTPGTAGHRFIYSNKQMYLHVYRVEGDELVQEWETTALGSRIASMVVSDLYADGELKLVIGTMQGRVLIYDLGSYTLEWENTNSDFDRIADLKTANLDQDPQEEIVILANNLLHIIDGFERNIQWVSQAEFGAKRMLIDNVDDDPQFEIILNTGRVIDSRFYNIELEADGPFGDRITLMDVNNDGFLDVFGEFGDFTIRVYDIYAAREIW